MKNTKKCVLVTDTGSGLAHQVGEDLYGPWYNLCAFDMPTCQTVLDICTGNCDMSECKDVDFATDEGLAVQAKFGPVTGSACAHSNHAS